MNLITKRPDGMSKKTMSITFDLETYNELLLYAKAKGHGTQYPVAALLHYAVFQQMKKYPLTEHERKTTIC